jgi:quercetin dioxygenase-like cupin family protein
MAGRDQEGNHTRQRKEMEHDRRKDRRTGVDGGLVRDDPTMRIRVNFPFYVGTGTKSTAVVYFEIEPGCRLGTHTDSAEEIVLILEGEAEATVGDERGRVSAGEMAVLPAMVPHGFRNVGTKRSGSWVLL